MTDRHTMRHVETLPDGAERYRCPECGRQFTMQWPPNYHRVIEVAGDESVIHGGTSGVLAQGAGLQLGAEAQEREPGELPPENASDAPYWLELED